MEANTTEVATSGEHRLVPREDVVNEQSIAEFRKLVDGISDETPDEQFDIIGTEATPLSGGPYFGNREKYKQHDPVILEALVTACRKLRKLVSPSSAARRLQDTLDSRTRIFLALTNTNPLLALRDKGDTSLRSAVHIENIFMRRVLFEESADEVELIPTEPESTTEAEA